MVISQETGGGGRGEERLAERSSPPLQPFRLSPLGGPALTPEQLLVSLGARVPIKCTPRPVCRHLVPSYVRNGKSACTGLPLPLKHDCGEGQIDPGTGERTNFGQPSSERGGGWLESRNVIEVACIGTASRRIGWPRVLLEPIPHWSPSIHRRTFLFCLQLGGQQLAARKKNNSCCSEVAARESKKGQGRGCVMQAVRSTSRVP